MCAEGLLTVGVRECVLLDLAGFCDLMFASLVEVGSSKDV